MTEKRIKMAIIRDNNTLFYWRALPIHNQQHSKIVNKRQLFYNKAN